MYSLIQHSKDRGTFDVGTEGTNGRLVGPGVQRTPQLSGRPIHGIPLPGMMGLSPSCFSQKQVKFITYNLDSSSVLKIQLNLNLRQYN